MTEENWDPASFTDTYQSALHKWAHNVANGKPQKKSKHVAHKKSSNVIDFVELLKKSLSNKKHSNNANHSSKKVKKKN